MITPGINSTTDTNTANARCSGSRSLDFASRQVQKIRLAHSASKNAAPQNVSAVARPLKVSISIAADYKGSREVKGLEVERSLVITDGHQDIETSGHQDFKAFFDVTPFPCYTFGASQNQALSWRASFTVSR